jgi:hypothetical protein
VAAALAALVVFFAILWGHLMPFGLQLLTDPSLSLGESFGLIGSTLLYSFGDVSSQLLIYYVFLSALMGINVSLLVFFVRLRRAAPPTLDLSSGVIGFVVGLLGLGCAACGSIFTSALFATVGAGIFASLPFHGAELGVLASLLLLISIASLAHAINKPAVCPI